MEPEEDKKSGHLGTKRTEEYKHVIRVEKRRQRALKVGSWASQTMTHHFKMIATIRRIELSTLCSQKDS